MASTTNNKNITFERNTFGTVYMNNMGTDNGIKVNTFWLGLTPNVKSFVGREKQLKRLTELLNQGKYVAICGLGGIGKTELARKYAWTYKEKYRGNIAWISAETREKIKSEFYELAKKLHIDINTNDKERDIKHVVVDVYKHIEEHVDAGLLIFDNAENMEDIGPYLPFTNIENSKLNVILTSQTRVWCEDINAFELDVLSDDEALDFIRREISADEDKAKELCKKLQNLPLALIQAVAYIKYTNIESTYTAEDYINEYEKLIGRQRKFPHTFADNYGKTVCVTVELTLEKIKNIGTEDSELALNILYVMAYMAAEDVEEKMLLKLVTNGNEKTLKAALRKIVEVSLVSRKEITGPSTRTFDMHRMVQTVLRMFCESQMMDKDILSKALHVCNGYYYVNSVHVGKYYSNTHLSSVLTHIEETNNVKVALKYYKDQVTNAKRLFFCALSYNGCYKAMKYIIKKSRWPWQRNVLHRGDWHGLTPLALALGQRHTDIATMLTEYGAKVTAVPGQLYWDTSVEAIEEGDIDTVRILIPIVANVKLLENKHGYKGETLLHLAAKHGHLDMVKVLHEHKANIHAVDYSGWTPLHWACWNGHTDTATLLITKNADINATDNSGQTPLLIALEKRHTDTAALLITNNAKINATDTSGSTPLHKACLTGHTDTAALLITNNAKINATDTSCSTPLHKACLTGHTNTTTLLIRHDAKINATNIRGSTPLHMACLRGHTDTATLLITNNAKINATDNSGWTPLHKACFRGHTDTATLLITNNADINATDFFSQTPLHKACWNGHTDTATVLITNNADINATDDSGQTPLHMACFRGHTDTATLLITRNADINATDILGRTPLHIASEQGHTDIRTLLIEHGAK